MAESGVLARFKQGDWESLKSWQFNALALVFAVYYTGREFFRDRAPILSASLAFTTAISIVPLLSVVTSIFAVFGTFEEESPGIESFLQQAFPAVAAEVADYLAEFSTSAATLGSVSAVIFLVVGILLFMEMESAFNVVWGAPKDRKFFKKLLNFYFVVTIGPLFLSLSVGLSARAQLVLSRMGLESGFFLNTFVPYLLVFGLFTLMHWLLPHTKVRWPAAIVGGLFTAYAFKAAQWGFNLYVNEVIFESYRTIYGALGLIPISLLWIYVSWILVMIGAELAYCVQHLRTLVEVDAAQQRLPSKQKASIHNPLVGLEVLAPIARHFKEGHGSIPENDLIRTLGYNEVFLRSVVSELSDMGAVRSVEDPETGERGVIPAKQLDDIALLPIARHFFDVPDSNSLPMNDLALGYRDLMNQVLTGKNALGLVAENSDIMRSLQDDPWKPVKRGDEPTKVDPAQADEPVGYDLPSEVEKEEEPYREATFLDIPDIPDDEPADEPPPGLNGASDAELTPKIDAPDAISASEELSDTLDAGENAPRVGEDPPSKIGMAPSDYSEPAIPVSDDLVVEESEAFEDEHDSDDDLGIKLAPGDESLDAILSEISEVEVNDIEDDEESDIPEVVSGEDVDQSIDIDLGDDWEDFDVNDALSEAELESEPDPAEELKKRPLSGIFKKAPAITKVNPNAEGDLKQTADVELTEEESEKLKKLRESSKSLDPSVDDM